MRCGYMVGWKIFYIIKPLNMKKIKQLKDGQQFRFKTGRTIWRLDKITPSACICTSLKGRTFYFDKFELVIPINP